MNVFIFFLIRSICARIDSILRSHNLNIIAIKCCGMENAVTLLALLMNLTTANWLRICWIASCISLMKQNISHFGCLICGWQNICFACCKSDNLWTINEPKTVQTPSKLFLQFFNQKKRSFNCLLDLFKCTSSWNLQRWKKNCAH